MADISKFHFISLEGNYLLILLTLLQRGKHQAILYDFAD